MDATPDVIDVESTETPPEVVTEHRPVTLPAVIPQPSTFDLEVLPSSNELRGLAQMANTFALSDLVPAPLKGKPADVLLVLLTARDLGLSVTVALRECHPIDGRVTVSPKLKMAIVRQRGLGRIWGDAENGINHHTWYAARADDPETVYRVTYTWADAQRAGLVQGGCLPDEHSAQCDKGSQYGATRQERAKACKSNWRTYPGQMLQWRAVGYLMDQAFGEVGTGLYSPDELGGVTDDDGHVIDVLEVGGVEGIAGKGGGLARSVAEDLAPQDERDRIAAKIKALPDPAIEDLREQWARQDRDGIPTLWPLGRLPIRQVKVAHALIDGFLKRAGKSEWGPWTPPEGLDLATGAPAPPETPDTDPAPTATDPAPEAATGDPRDVVAPEPVVGEALDGIIAHVQGLDLLDVEDALASAGVNVSGKANTDRARLAQYLASTGFVPPDPEAAALEAAEVAAEQEG